MKLPAPTANMFLMISMLLFVVSEFAEVYALTGAKVEDLLCYEERQR